MTEAERNNIESALEHLHVLSPLDFYDLAETCALKEIAIVLRLLSDRLHDIDMNGCLRESTARADKMKAMLAGIEIEYHGDPCGPLGARGSGQLEHIYKALRNCAAELNSLLDGKVD